MAAPPTKPASEGSPVATDTVNDAPLKEAPPVEPTEATAAPRDTAQPVVTLKAPPAPPSYQDSYKSTYCTTARSLLQAGSLEQALEVLQQGFDSLVGVDDLAPARAPLHYLYGTTLLYILEEADVTTPVDPEDVEVAWQHLEVARTLLEQLEPNKEHSLALAQVRLRQGDWQRMQNFDALDDLQACLALRKPYCAWDRSLADVYYQLGMAHQMAVMEQNKKDSEQSEATKDSKPAAFAVEDSKEATEDSKPVAAVAEPVDHRLEAIRNYHLCAETLIGQLATLAGQDPASFVEDCRAQVDSLKSSDEDTEATTLQAKLAILATASSKLVPTAAGDPVFAELRDLVTEIHETVQEAATTEEGMDQVQALKQEITAAIKAEAEGPTFDAPTQEHQVVQTVAVKKKKKRPVEDAKMPADPSKRPRSE